MKELFERILFPWSKWEVYKTDETYFQAQVNFPLALGGKIIGEDKVLVDIYVRTHKFNGIKQYKQVVKYR